MSTNRPAAEIRATAYAAPTLHAPVRVLGDLTRSQVTVETLPGGVGGWRNAGRRFVVSTSILRDITEFEPPTPVATEDAPVAGKREPAPEVDTRSPELIAAEEELAALTARIAAHFDARHGTSRMRGKQHNIRVDAAIRRAAKMADQHRVLFVRVNRMREKEGLA